MNIIDYYFIKEYQWKNKWYSKKGVLKVKVFPSNDFIKQNGYVDFNLVGQIFTSKKEFQDVMYINSIISEIGQVLRLKENNYKVSSEIVLLDINGPLTKPIDLLGDSEGIEAPLSWNHIVSQELQYIPTTEIFQLFKDWKSFLEEQKGIKFA